MLCPECGAIVAPGPLDLRRALHGAHADAQRDNGIARLLGRAVTTARRMISSAMLFLKHHPADRSE